MGLEASKSSVKEKITSYSGFQGIDVSRDVRSLETGEKQALSSLVNGYCDWQGLITNEPGFERRVECDGVVRHISFFGNDLLAWTQDEGAFISVNSDTPGTYQQDAFPGGSIITSTVFNRKVIMGSADTAILTFDGSTWADLGSPTLYDGRYVAAVQRRLAVAGVTGYPTRVFFSRVDDENVMPDDEDVDSVAVTKAMYLDIANLVSTAEEIRGISAFESSRLAIFTTDRVIVYSVDPDYTRWSIDDKINIRDGTISHNTIKEAGQDLFYCSRIGVHSLRRSETNGLVLYTLPLSNRVQRLYRKLVLGTTNPESISACYDADSGRYHIFFPRKDGAERLSLTIHPMSPEQQQPVYGTWSTGDSINATCAAFLSGRMVFGAKRGIHNLRIDSEVAGSRSDCVATTPILWHGDLVNPKKSGAFILQASGDGEIFVEAFDDQGRKLSSYSLQVSHRDDETWPINTLADQNEFRFEHVYRGVQFKFTIKSNRRVTIDGFAVKLRS